MSQTVTASVSAPILRRRLLTSCAGAAMAVAASYVVAPQQASAQGLVGTPTANGAQVTNNNTLVTVTSTNHRAIVDWNNAANDFLPTGNSVTFTGPQDYIVLNRVMATNGAAPVRFDGTVNSNIGGQIRGGQVWFYSPSGILVGGGARFNVGSLLLTTANIADNDFLDGNDSFTFQSAPGSTAAIVINPYVGAANQSQISALGENSYVALIAPRVRQSGKITVEGTAQYVAAEGMDVTIRGSLFDISFEAGVGTGVTGTGPTDAALVHDGETNISNESGYGANSGTWGRTATLVAVPKNSAVTMLVTGSFNYTEAVEATVLDNRIILSGGYDVVEGNPANDPRGLADIRIRNASFDTTVIGVSTRSATAVADGGNLSFGQSLLLTAPVEARLDALAGNATVGGAVQLNASGTTTAGTAGMRVGAGSSITIGNTAQLLANALGTYINDVGGDAQAGSAIVTVDAGAIGLDVGSGLLLQADGEGGGESGYGAGGAGGDGTGGIARLEAQGGVIDLPSLGVYARGNGGNAGSGPAGASGGDGTGGTAEFIVAGDATADVSSLFVSADGTGGQGGSGSSEQMSGNGGAGGNGTGGFATLTVSSNMPQGLDVANLELHAEGDGGDGGFGTNGGAGGIGQGGEVTLNIFGDVVYNSLSLDARGEGGYGGSVSFEGMIGRGGNGTGGDIMIDVTGNLRPEFGGEGNGYFYADAIGIGGSSLENGYGESAGGGIGQGGNILIDVSGQFVTGFDGEGSSFFANASGLGGFSFEFGYGESAGGLIELDVVGIISVIDPIVLKADGGGGNDVFDPFGDIDDALGGDGTGGTINVTMSGVIQSDDDGFDPQLLLLARGVGGNGIGYSGSIGRVGGDGQGGDVTLTLSGITSEVPDINIDARGFGGEGGTGGNGTGGNVVIEALNGSDVETGELYVDVSGFGGEGGFADRYYGIEGAFDGGAGGIGTGGTVMLAANFDSSLRIPTGVIIADGQGGAGGYGSYADIGDDTDRAGHGGAGGAGVGGSITILGGADSELRLTRNLFTARGYGGQGASGGETGYGSMIARGGDGGDGGAGTGGDIVVRTRDGEVFFESGLSFSSEAGGLADGFGGDAGDGGYNPDSTPELDPGGNGTVAGGDFSGGAGGDGGFGTGGNIFFDVVGGTIGAPSSSETVGGLPNLDLVVTGYGGGGGIFGEGESFRSERVVGLGGNAQGGTIDIRLFDSGNRAGELRFAEATLISDTEPGVDFQGFVSGQGFSGSINIVELADPANGGGFSVQSLYAEASGAVSGNFFKINVESQTGSILVADDAEFVSDGGVRFSGDGGVDAGGSITVDAGYTSIGEFATGLGPTTLSAGDDITLNSAIQIAISSIEAGGNASFNGQVFVYGDANVEAGSIVSFANSVQGYDPVDTDNLTITSGNGTFFAGNIGEAQPGFMIGALQNLTVSGPVTLNGALVNTDADQTFNGDVVLNAQTAAHTFNSNDGGDISFNGALDGDYDVSVLTAGTSSFTGIVGDIEELASLTTDTPGTTALGGQVYTNGTQTYGDAVEIVGGTYLTSSGTGAAGNISFARAVYGGESLAIGTAGSVSFGGAVGATDPLQALAVFAGAGITGSSARVVNDLSLETDGAIAFGSLIAGDDIEAFADGTITLSSATTTGLGDDNETGYGFDDNIGSNILLSAGGAISVADANAFNNLLADGGSFSSTGDLIAGDDIIIGSEGAIAVASATAGDDIIAFGDGAITFTSATTTGLGQDGGEFGYGEGGYGEGGYGGFFDPDGSNIRLNGVGAIRLDDGSAINLVELGSSTGAVLSSGLITAQTLDVTAATNIALNDLDIQNGIFLTTTAGTISGNDFDSGGAIALTSSSDINVLGLVALTTIEASGGNLTLGTLDAGGRITLDATGNIVLATAEAAGDFIAEAGGTFTADTIITTNPALPLVGIRGAGVAIDPPGNSISVENAGALTIRVANSAGGVNLQSTGGAVQVTTDLVAAGPIDASGTSVNLNAINALAIRSATATAGNNALTAGGNLTVQQASATGTLNATSGATLALDGTIGGTEILLASRDIAIGSAALVGTTSQTQTLAITANAGQAAMQLGGTAGSAGYTLDNAELGRLASRDISFFTAGSSGDLQVAAVTLRGAGASNPNVTRNFAVGHQGNINVTGRVAIDNASAQNLLRLGANQALFVDLGAGGISVLDGSNALVGSLELRGQTILVSTTAARTAVQGANSIGARDTRLGQNDGAVNDAGVLRAGGVRLVASQRIHVQNTGGSDNNARAGISAGAGGIALVSSSQGTPVEVIINGRQTAGGTTFTGQALIDELILESGYGSFAAAAGSTVNGCPFSGGGTCGIIIVEPDPVFFDPELDTVVGELIREIEGEGDPQPPDIIFSDLIRVERAALAPIIDEPVTGSGNDDLYTGFLDDDDDEDEETDEPVTGSGNESLVNQPAAGSAGNQPVVDEQVTGSGNEAMVDNGD